VCFLHFAHEAAGATGTRLSLRPLFFEGFFLHSSGASRRENEELHLVVIASEAKQSILSLRLHGLLRFARNDGVGTAVAVSQMNHTPGTTFDAIPDVPIAE
jgi:hypothetical protein